MLRRCYHCQQPLSWSDDALCAHCHRPLDRRVIAAMGGIERFLRRIEEAEKLREVDDELARELRGACDRRRDALEFEGRKAALEVPLDIVLEPEDTAPSPPPLIAAPPVPAAPVAPAPVAERHVPPAPPPTRERPRPVAPPPAPVPDVALHSGLPPRVARAPRPPGPVVARTRPAPAPTPPRETPRWVGAVRSILFENVLWFVAGFLIVSGAVYFAATTWTRWSDQTRYAIVLASVISLGALLGGLGWLLARKFELAGEGLVCFLLANLIAPVLFLVAGQGWSDLDDPALGFLLAAISGLYLLALALAQGSSVPVASWLGQAAPLAAFGALATILPNLEFGEPVWVHLVAIYGGFAVLWVAFLHPGEPGEFAKNRPRGPLARYYLPSVFGAAYVALLANLFRVHPHDNPGLYSVAILLAGALVVNRESGLLGARIEDENEETPITTAAIAGLALTILGLVLGASSKGTLLVTTALATAIYAVCARRHGKAWFVGMALAASAVAYLLSPTPIAETVRRIRTSASESFGYGGKQLPLSYYGLTFLPYLAGVAWFARRFRVRENAAFFKVTAGWLVTLSVGLLVLVNSFQDDLRPHLFTLPVYGVGFLAAGVLLRLEWLHYLGSFSLTLFAFQLSRYFEWDAPNQAAMLAVAGIAWQGVGWRLGDTAPGRAFSRTALGLLVLVTGWLVYLGVSRPADLSWYAPALVGFLAITNALSLRQAGLTVLGVAALTLAADLLLASEGWGLEEHGIFLVGWSWVLLAAAWGLRLRRDPLAAAILLRPLLGSLAVLFAGVGAIWIGLALYEGASILAALHLAQIAALIALAVPLWDQPAASHGAGVAAIVASLVASRAIFPDRDATFYALSLVPFAYLLLGLVLLMNRRVALDPFARAIRADAVGLGVAVFSFLFGCLAVLWFGLPTGELPLSGLSAALAFVSLAPLFHRLSRARGHHPYSGGLALAAPILALEGLLFHLGVSLEWQPFVLGAAPLALAVLPPRPVIRLAGGNTLRGAKLLRQALVPVATSLTFLVWVRAEGFPWPTLAGLGCLSFSTALLQGIPAVTGIGLAAFTLAAWQGLVGFTHTDPLDRHGTFLVAASAVHVALAWAAARATRARPALAEILARPILPILYGVVAFAAAYWSVRIPTDGESVVRALHVGAIAIVLGLSTPLARHPLPTHLATATAAAGWLVYLLTLRAIPDAGPFFYGLAFVGFAYATAGLGRVLSRGALLDLYRRPLRVDSIAIGIALFWYFTFLTMFHRFLPDLGSPGWSALSFVGLLPLYGWLAWTHEADPVRRVGLWLEVKAGYLALACPMMALASLMLWMDATVHSISLLVAAWGLAVSYLPLRRLVAAGGRNLVRSAPLLRATLAPAALGLMIGVYATRPLEEGAVWLFDLAAALVLVVQAARGARHPRFGTALSITFWVLLFASIYGHVLVHLASEWIDPVDRAPAMAVVAALAVLADRLAARREGWRPFGKALEVTIPLVLGPLFLWLVVVWGEYRAGVEGTLASHPVAVVVAALLGSGIGLALRREPARFGGALYFHGFLVAAIALWMPVTRLLEWDFAWKVPRWPSVDLAALGAAVAVRGLFQPDRGRSRAALFQVYPVVLAVISLAATGLELKTPTTAASFYAASLIALSLSLARREAWIGYVYGALFLAGIYWTIFWAVPDTGRDQVLILPLLSVVTLFVGAAVASLSRWLATREGLARDTAAVLGSLGDHCLWLASVLIAVGVVVVRPADAQDAETWNFVLTVASLVGVSGAMVSRHLVSGRARYVYLSAAAVLLGYGYLRWKVEVLPFLESLDGHVLLVLAIISYQVSRTVDEARRPGLARPLATIGLFLPAGAVAFLPGYGLGAIGSGLFALAAIHYGLVWLASGKRRFAYLAAAFLNLVFYDFFVYQEFDARFYGLPVGLSLLAFAQLNRKDLAPASVMGLRIAGFSLMYAAAVLQVFLQEADAGTLFFLAGLCVAGVLVGVRLASRGLVLVSAVTLVVDVVGHILLFGAALGFLGALALVLTGLAILGLALWTTFRKRRLSSTRDGEDRRP